MNKQLFIRMISEGNVSTPKILFSHYAKIGLNETQAMILLQIHTFISSGELFPTFEQLSERTTLKVEQIGKMIATLETNNYLSLEEREGYGNYNKVYSLTPLWERIYTFLVEDKVKKKEHVKGSQPNEKMSYGELFSHIEQEFSRPLSPMELEVLSIWIDEDDYSFDLIKAALRESVVAGKLSIRYIDRVLLNWKKNGITTLEQVKVYSEEFRGKYKRPFMYKNQKKEKVDHQPEEVTLKPSFNWLDN